MSFLFTDVCSLLGCDETSKSNSNNGTSKSIKSKHSSDNRSNNSSDNSRARFVAKNVTAIIPKGGHQGNFAESQKAKVPRPAQVILEPHTWRVMGLSKWANN